MQFFAPFIQLSIFKAFTVNLVKVLKWLNVYNTPKSYCFLTDHCFSFIFLTISVDDVPLRYETFPDVKSKNT